MAPTPQSVQKELVDGVNALKAATTTYPAMAKRYGSDWTKWPKTSKWYQGLTLLHQAGLDIATLLAPPLTADFTVS